MKRGTLFYCLLLSLIPLLAQANLDQAKLDAAYGAYTEGESALDEETRAEAFNRALQGYAELAEMHPNPALYYNLGNCYFQLGEPAWAILNYYRSLRLMPRSSRVQGNLEIAQQSLDIEAHPEHPVLRLSLFIHYYLAPFERTLLLAWTLSLTLFFSIGWLWLSSAKARRGTVWMGGSTLFILANIFYTTYVAPVEAVLVRSSALRRDAGHHYALLDQGVGVAGMKVRVLEVLKDGYWVRIELPGGIVGYVPHEVIQVL
jgi:tetratricopeptide (TPR) repeat protein